jgi:hypothetical protein
MIQFSLIRPRGRKNPILILQVREAPIDQRNGETIHEKSVQNPGHLQPMPLRPPGLPSDHLRTLWRF